MKELNCLCSVQRLQEVPYSRRRKVIWKNKCWVINTHPRIRTTSFPSTITTGFFLPHNIYFTLNIYGPVKFYTCTSERPWATLISGNNRGESSEAGGSSVLSSWCSSSVALTRIVILHAKEINPAKQIFLMLTLKTKQHIHLPQTRTYRINQVFSPTNQKALKDIPVRLP